MQNFKGFEEGREIVNVGDPEAFEKGVRARVTACERGGVRDRGRLCLRGFADLQRDERDVFCFGDAGEGLPCGNIAEPFDMQPDCSNALVF